jgi:hypothetical protein
MSLETIQSLLALAIGFSTAGVLASGYRLATRRAISFRLLERGPRITTLAAVPLLVFAAPFIIMRNTVRARRIEGRRFRSVMMATILAGLWSLMSGTIVVTALDTIGLV